MTNDDAWRAVPIPAGHAAYLIATAARAPSVQNTQPWRFRVSEYAIELYADPDGARKLPASRGGRWSPRKAVFGPCSFSPHAGTIASQGIGERHDRGGCLAGGAHPGRPG